MKRLDSWKEIAAYLGRDASTVRRWEKQEDLPVHRHGHQQRASVYAYAEELDRWRQNRKPDATETRSSQQYALAAGFVLVLLTAAWGLWRSGNLHVPYPLVEAAEAGMTLRKVWSGSEVDPYASVSPDGRYLSMIDYLSGDLAVRDLATGETRRLTGPSEWLEFAGRHRFSPDGKRIVYGWSGRQKTLDLRIVELARPEPKVIYTGDAFAALMPLDWTPDGSRILVVAIRADGTNALGFLSANGGKPQILKSLGWRWPVQARVSPDGRFVAYDFLPARDSAGHDINVLAILVALPVFPAAIGQRQHFVVTA